MKKSLPEPELSPPFNLGPISNGEFPPEPWTRRHTMAEELYKNIVEEKSRRLGMTRRKFIDSSCGMLAAAWVINQVSGCGGGSGGRGPGGSAGTGGSGGGGAGGGFTRDGGYGVPGDVSAEDAAMANQEAGYNAPKDALEDQARADALLTGDEFIFDVQVHNEMPAPPWGESVYQSGNPNTSPTEWMRQIFVASDTDVACLSGYPQDVPSIQARDGLRKLIDMVHGSPRLKIHCKAFPHRDAAALARAQQNAEMFPVAAWKTYPDPPSGARLNQADAFFELASRLGIKMVASHRGLGGGSSYEDFYSPLDVVAAAKDHPDFNFLVYHSGFDSGRGERAPYNETTPIGIDRLIKALKQFGIGPEGNVYAELGTTWNVVKNDPVQATHALGKLLLHLGPDRILWGTDSLNDGNAAGQIAMFRLFQMDPALQATYGYPPLTAEVKRKIFGLNAARIYGVDPTVVRQKVTSDDISRLRLALKDDPRSVPSSPYRHHGPRTWREYLGFKKWRGEAV
jgi:predicted TIM-barrel fold metal-dependent hydrolase